MAIQKKYICGFCARAFTRSEHKQRHERLHTNEKPFHCVYCTSAFVRRDLLQRHCRTVHNIKLLAKRKTPPASPDALATPSVAATLVEEPSPSPPESPDIVHLLLVAKNLEALVDPAEAADATDTFLVGYTTWLAEHPFPSFKGIASDLVGFLNSNIHNAHHRKNADFKVCLIYALLSVGALGREEAPAYLSKAWDILINRLIPNYNSLVYQMEILKNLFVVAHVYLSFHNNSLVLNYLDDTSYIILENLANNNRDIIAANTELFWDVYVFLSNYRMNDRPPKFFRFFLDQPVPGCGSLLRETMVVFARSAGLLLADDIVVLTLSNELNHYIHHHSLLIYDDKNALHNLIILVNKSIRKDSDDADVFRIFKKKLLINSPPRFKELFGLYVFKPEQKAHWNLLIVLLRECSAFDLNGFVGNNVNSAFHPFATSLLDFFEAPTPSEKINNNLGIATFPLVFGCRFLKTHRKDVIDLKFNLDPVNSAQLSSFALCLYLTSFKMLHALVVNHTPENIDVILGENYVFQGLVYLLNDNSLAFQWHNKDWVLGLFNKLFVVSEHWLAFFRSQEHLIAIKNNINKFLNDLLYLSVGYPGDISSLFADLIVGPENLTLRNKRSKSISSLEHPYNPISALSNRSNYVLKPELSPTTTVIQQPAFLPSQGTIRNTNMPQELPTPQSSLLLPPISYLYNANKEFKQYPGNK